MNQGDTGDNFYIVEKGEIECGNVDKDGNFKVVRQLGPGNHFGEIAIIRNV